MRRESEKSSSIKTQKPGAVPDGPEALQAFTLSPSVVARFETYAALLRKWQRTINLVAPSTLDRLWTRHFADSLQVMQGAPEARFWMDVGSGAGFPGLAIAMALADEPGTCVHLVESDQRKCAFLRDVSRETGAPVKIHTGRAEQLFASFDEPIEAVTARALAPLQNLILLTAPILENGAVGVFPQGQSTSSELTDSQLINRFNVETRPSRTSPGSWLAIVRANSTI